MWGLRSNGMFFLVTVEHMIKASTMPTDFYAWILDRRPM